ncbi:MAG: plasmid mobilization relaxosome protein MobC [Clostridiaceae bacterium]|nr:plasmid mobilization relaxosome protein MobC [Clostridiaceae bacterium]
MTKRRRPRQVKFWATDEELQLIKKKIEISKLSQQEYLLRSALEKNILVIEGIKELIIELTKEGNELRNLSSKLEGENQEKVWQITDRLMGLWNQIDKTIREGKE